MTSLPAHNPSDDSPAPWWKLRARWLYESLVAGELRDHSPSTDAPYAVRLEAIGTLAVPGGYVVAADPYTMELEPVPFNQRLGVDEAHVVAARAIIGEDHERFAALILHTGTNPVVDWAMATLADQDVATLQPEGYFGYGVDAGTGSFGSPEAMRTTARVLRADAGDLLDPVSTALFADAPGVCSAALVAPEDGAVPVAVCESGWGDGVYPTWLGLDESGEVMVAVTDFMLTVDPHAAPLPTQTPQPPPTETAATGQRPRSLLRRLFGS